MAIKQKISNAANKVEKAVAKVDEVIAIADPVSDRFLDLIKNSKRTALVVIIIAFIIWLI
jgi:hypothetical protein